MPVKVRYAGRFFLILLCAFILAFSAFVPANIASPEPAQAGIMKWDTVSTPGTYATRNDILFRSEIDRFVVGPTGNMLAIVTKQDIPPLSLMSSNDGINWGGSSALTLTMLDVWGVVVNCWDVAIAPDDSRYWAVVTSSSTVDAPVEVWVSEDGGSSWEMTNVSPLLAAGETIRSISISVSTGAGRDIAVGTVTGGGGGNVFIIGSSAFASWQEQLDPLVGIDYFEVLFSPTYNGDSSLAMVYADGTATYFNVAYRDINTNAILNFAYASPGIEVKNPSSAAGSSPSFTWLRETDLELPSDFSGQSSSLRRAYISLDAVKSPADQTGIYRIDDTTQYILMDTTTVLNKDIYSIAYFGTYASGKLLAGERWGFPCSATVPTWFTDSPTTCPIPCWYPALKPTTGAAGDQGEQQDECSVDQIGSGGAIVNWGGTGLDGSLGLVTTGSLLTTTGDAWYLPWTGIPTFNDESAFAISRNNGETWNQLALIDTTIDWFNDVAVPTDGTTLYLASVNRNAGGVCDTFDSVWRSTINPNVAAPLAAIPPVGYYWERVFTHVTSGSCAVPQSDLPILRVVNSCIEKKDGEIVGWAAQLANSSTGTNGGVMAWSPDYGDYWAMITPRDVVQDFAFESSTILYTVSPTGLVQRLPYTGTSWSTNLPSYDSTVGFAHTIAVQPNDKVMVGTAYGGAFPVAYSFNKGINFDVVLDAITGHGNEHVIFDVDFKDNAFIYMGDDKWGGLADGAGTVYRNTIPSFTRWVDDDLMSAANGATGITWPVVQFSPPHPVGIYGLVQAWTGTPQQALYAAHSWIFTSPSRVDANATVTYTSIVATTENTSIDVTPVSGLIKGTATTTTITGYTGPVNSAVCRTLAPRVGMPKPGVEWDCLDIFAPPSTQFVQFTLEPTSLKYSGCCNLNTNTTLYAIDDQSGNWWGWNTLSTGYAGLLRSGIWNNHLNNPAMPWDTNYPGYTPTMNQGMLWAYTDCLAKKGPVLKSPVDQFLIGADPVTGRNQQVDLAWEQLCLSTAYEIIIAKDKEFTLKIDPTQNNANLIGSVVGPITVYMDKGNMTSPAMWIAPGALPEAGAIYYWKVRSYQSATGQYAWSPWSEKRSFVVKPGFIVNTPYYGVQLLSPNNGGIGIAINPTQFSWSPWKEATKYQFDLAKDSEFKQLLTTATTSTAAYSYTGKLDYSTSYFWRVKALEVKGKNIPSDWSATFSFQTKPAPASPAPPAQEPGTPVWVWVIIAIGAILVIVTLVLIFTTRRV